MLGIAWLQRKLLFPSHLVQLRAQPSLPADGERWWLDTEQGRVEAWFLPGHGVSARAPGPLLLFAHGNGELIDDWPELLAPYRSNGLNVLLPEYRSYGRSAGTPGERALVGDLRAFLARAASDPRIDAERIVYHGRSLGGAVMCALARELPPRALILESTFTSVFDMARALHLPVPRMLLHDRFDSLGALAGFARPVLVMHGAKDTLVPIAQGRRLVEVCKDVRFVVFDEAGHNDLPWQSARYWEAVRELLARGLGRDGAGR
jgi:pimeloyl-ACP methyl ester carboxylesterase